MKTVSTLAILFIFQSTSLAQSNMKPSYVDITQKDTILTAYGPEDMLLDTSGVNPRLIISCGDFRNVKNINRRGAIYSYDLRTGVSAPFSVEGFDSKNLFPHGISLMASNPAKLYVINHGSDDKKENNEILVFTIKDNVLRLDTLLKDPCLTTPNDLFVLPDGSFYVSNEGGLSVGALLSRLFSRPSNVVYFDAATSSFRKAYRKVTVANGLHVIGDKLYVADAFKKKLLVLNIAADRSLTLNSKIKVSKGLDNISVSQAGDKFYIPAHDNVFKLNATRKKQGRLSPFSVYEIDIHSTNVTKLICNNGSLISAVSTALVSEQHLYLSQIFDNYILKLKLN